MEVFTTSYFIAIFVGLIVLALVSLGILRRGTAKDARDNSISRTNSSKPTTTDDFHVVKAADDSTQITRSRKTSTTKDEKFGDSTKNAGKIFSEDISSSQPTIPLSVNYHFTRQCNYECGFCFHNAKTSFCMPLDEAKKGLQLLQEKGMEKVNFSGGEPFLVKRGEFVGELCKYSKETLNLPSVSIVSNGSLITEKWFEKYGEYLDILAVSCDSFDPDVNEKIGRQQGQKNHLHSLRQVREWCHQYKVAFKLNTVVNTHNKDEDMIEPITELKPCRWKVFQCLLIGGENSGEDAVRHAESFVISDADFNLFLDIHKTVTCLVPESNEFMRNSYLILDEYMRFLDCTKGKKDPSKSILDVGVDNALLFSGFDEKMFLKRGGKYVWSKADLRLEW